MYENVKSVNFHNHPFNTFLKGKSSLLLFFRWWGKNEIFYLPVFFLHFIIITVSFFVFFILLRSELYHAEPLLFYSTNDFIIDNLCKFHTIYQNIFTTFATLTDIFPVLTLIYPLTQSKVKLHTMAHIFIKRISSLFCYFWPIFISKMLNVEYIIWIVER